MNWWKWPSVLWLVLALSGTVAAGQPTEQIKATTDRILAIVSDPALAVPEREEERKMRIRDAVGARFDWPEMSSRSLARHWLQRTEAEKKEFIRLFSRLLERTYLEKVEGYSGEKVLYEGEVRDERYPDLAIVEVKIVTHTDKEIAVAYKVRRVGDQWLVYDIAIEGVSMVNNYRKQFRDMSYPEIVERLKQRVGDR